MVDIFQITVERLVEFGVYKFLLPFVLLTTVLYAVLRKTQILGDSVIIHGIISVTVGLFIFGLPVLVGSSITEGLTAFLTQGSIIILVLLFGFLVASFFYPNIVEKLPDIFKSGGPAVWVIWAIVGVAATVGLFSVFGKFIGNIFGSVGVPSGLGALTGVLAVIFIIFLLVALAGGKEVK